MAWEHTFPRHIFQGRSFTDDREVSSRSLRVFAALYSQEGSQLVYNGGPVTEEIARWVVCAMSWGYLPTPSAM
jgi:hypothetical protein